MEYFEENPAKKPKSIDAFLAVLADAQMHYVHSNMLVRLQRTAKMKYPNACVEDIDYKAKRKLDQGTIQSLSNCKWIESGHHVVIEGATGVGKTWLGCALGNQAIRSGIKVLYKRFSLLIEELQIARGDGTLPLLRKKISRAKLLILDDFGLATLTQESCLDLLEIIEERVGKGSLLITSQLPTTAWYQYFGESTVADAILDRLIHRAHILGPRGDSMRKLYADMER
jgi:DNA replication protein DnaC